MKGMPACAATARQIAFMNYHRLNFKNDISKKEASKLIGDYLLCLKSAELFQAKAAMARATDSYDRKLRSVSGNFKQAERINGKSRPTKY